MKFHQSSAKNLMIVQNLKQEIWKAKNNTFKKKFKRCLKIKAHNYQIYHLSWLYCQTYNKKFKKVMKKRFNLL